VGAWRRGEVDQGVQIFVGGGGETLAVEVRGEPHCVAEADRVVG